MPELSKLFVVIGAKTGEFQKGMKGMQKDLTRTGLAVAAVGAAVVALGVKSVRTFARMGDEVQKMALRTGFSTEALSELRFAAEQSGTDISGLEKAVKRMSKALVDADDGLLETKRAFDSLGLTAGELIKLKPEEAFFKIAGALGELDNDFTRAARAQDIFGRAGTQLLPLIAAGAEGIARLRQEARDLGIVFDQEAANKAARLTDALNSLKQSTNGLQIALAEGLAPVISDISEGLAEDVSGVTQFIKKNEGLVGPLVKTTGEMGLFAVALGGAAVILPKLIGAISPLGGLLLLLGVAVGGLSFVFNTLIDQADKRIAQIKDETQVTILNFRLMVERQKLLKGEKNELIGVLEQSIKLVSARKDQTDAQKEWIQSAQATVKMLKDIENASRQTTDALETMTVKQRILAIQSEAIAGRVNEAFKQFALGQAGLGQAPIGGGIGGGGGGLTGQQIFENFLLGQGFRDPGQFAVPPGFQLPGGFDLRTGQQIAPTQPPPFAGPSPTDPTGGGLTQINTTINLDGQQIAEVISIHQGESLETAQRMST